MNTVYMKQEPLHRQMVHERDLRPREIQVRDLILKGMNASEIAAHLNLSVGTTRQYIHRVYIKYGVHTRTELAIKCASGFEPERMSRSGRGPSVIPKG